MSTLRLGVFARVSLDERGILEITTLVFEGNVVVGLVQVWCWCRGGEIVGSIVVVLLCVMCSHNVEICEKAM